MKINEVSWAGQEPLALRPALLCAAIYLMVLPFGHITAVRSLSLFLAAMLTLMVWVRDERKDIPLLGMFGLWLAAAGLSLLTSSDPTASLDAIEGEIVRSLLVYGVFFTLARQANAIVLFGWATAIASLALGGLAIFVMSTQGHWRPGHLPALGDFATAAITLLPLLVIAALFGGRLLRIVSSLASGGLLVGGYLTYSRGFWLTLLVAVTTVVVASAYRRGTGHWKAILGLTLAGILAIALAAQVAEQRGSSLARFWDRSVIYLPVANKILGNPLTGTGYGHETDHAWYRTVPGMDGQVSHAHNIVLSYLDQMGPAGLLVIMALFGMPALFFIQRLTWIKTAPLALAGLALLAAVFIKNNLDIFFRGANLWLFFAHLGIYMGSIARIEQQAAPRNTHDPIR